MVPLPCTDLELQQCRSEACQNATMALIKANNAVTADCTQLSCDSGSRTAYAALAATLLAAAVALTVAAAATSATIFGIQLGVVPVSSQPLFSSPP